jgi:hypothetical protein
LEHVQFKLKPREVDETVGSQEVGPVVQLLVEQATIRLLDFVIQDQDQDLDLD